MNRRAIALLFALFSATCAYAQAPAELQAALNALRGKPAGCAGGAAGAAPPQLASTALGKAAATLAGSPGLSLDDALARAGYRQQRAMVWHISGISDPAPLAAFAQQNFCRDLHARDLTEIGIFQGRSGPDAGTWIVLALPQAVPSPAAAPAIGQRVLALTNQARAQARMCGHQRFERAPPLVWDDRLARASLAHATEMARGQYLEHAGRDGSGPPERVTRAGYQWRAVGENIASGQSSAEEVTAGWIASPHHCANLMSPKFSAMGVAFAISPEGRTAMYWTQLFAAPQ
jgi:uncharacterized protein YkwD